MLTGIPCTLMRGGTSKGPFFLAADLPADARTRDQVLLAVMGSPDLRQIDGIGGGDTLSSKVAIVGPSERPGIHVEYLFAQVSVDRSVVDTAPNCGNMLAGVGPFAIERGLVRGDGRVDHGADLQRQQRQGHRVRRADARWQGDLRRRGTHRRRAGQWRARRHELPRRRGRQDRQAAADRQRRRRVRRRAGVVRRLQFSAGLRRRVLDRQERLRIQARNCDQDKDLLAASSGFARQAALRMGMGDVSGKVLPKIALLAGPRHGGNISSRYFVPWNCHAAHAITGALCVAAACVIPDSVASMLVNFDIEDANRIVVEHPAGQADDAGRCPPGRRGAVADDQTCGHCRHGAATASPVSSMFPGPPCAKAA